LVNLYLSTNPKKSEEYANQLLAIAKISGDKKAEVDALYNLGIIFNSLNDYDQALDYYQKSLEISKKMNFYKEMLMLVISWNNL